MGFRELVAREVRGRHAGGGDACHEGVELLVSLVWGGGQGDAEQDVGDCVGGVAVGEFGHGVREDGFDEF